tara:strand:- start:444 stop:1121 length:678 start_codon:yes stop_codon:yes gene_type:complete
MIDGEYDIDNLTDDIVELAKAFQNNDEPVHLIGHDWGAVLTWMAVAHHPELFKSATTLAVPHPIQFFELLIKSPAQLGRSGYMGLFQLRTLSDWVVARDNFSFIDMLWKKWSPGYEPSEIYMRELKECLKQSLPSPLNYYRRILRPLIPSIRRLVDPKQPERNIKVPVLSITGLEDGCISTKGPIDGTRFMQAPFKHIEIQAGHFMHLEAPTEVNTAISSWIQSN